MSAPLVEAVVINRQPLAVQIREHTYVGGDSSVFSNSRSYFSVALCYPDPVVVAEFPWHDYKFTSSLAYMTHLAGTAEWEAQYAREREESQAVSDRAKAARVGALSRARMAADDLAREYLPPPEPALPMFRSGGFIPGAGSVEVELQPGETVRPWTVDDGA